MPAAGVSLDTLRRALAAAGGDSDVFSFIEAAISLAAADFPDQLRARRDRIVEMLYVALPALPCARCDAPAPASASAAAAAAALSDAIEEERLALAEVARIKETLLRNQEHPQPESELLESLRRLQLMELSVEMLKATQIGKAVNGFRKHNSKQIQKLAKQLIEDWKVLVDDWVRATTAITKQDSSSPDSTNPSVVDDEEEEEGLPSPPLDEGAFLAAPVMTPMRLSELFDGMNEDGYFSNANESGSRRRCEEKQRERDRGTRQSSGISSKPPQGNGRSSMAAPAGARAGIAAQKQRHSEFDDKLERAKRKLHEGYQQAENAKKQRTIQVMEIGDIPATKTSSDRDHRQFGRFRGKPQSSWRR